MIRALCAAAMLSTLATACARRPRAAPVALSAAPGVPAVAPTMAWLKGQTHLHSDRSGDSRTPPETVVRWYAAHGYDFIVFTDHNVVTRPRPSPRPTMLVLSGAELTWNAPTCGPPSSPCNLHLNALFAAAPANDRTVALAPANPGDRASVFAAELALTSALGGVAQLNHPNYHYAADAALLAGLAAQGLRLVEFSNASLGCQNEGDATHPSTEALWDAVLDRGADVWNVASDDAHHYEDAATLRARGETVYEGDRGWVMVHAAREPGALRAAMVRGEFYSSTGPRIARIDGAGDALRLRLESPARTRFLGDGGRVLATVDGVEAALPLASLPTDLRWVRAVVDDGAGRRAWVQPLRVRRAGATVSLQGPFGRSPAAPPASSAPPAPDTDTDTDIDTSADETWDTESDPVLGRGAGDIAMRLTRAEGLVRLRYDGGDMRCTLRGARCVGTWRGRTGLGWFEVTFDASSRTFDGTWGYDDDRAHAAGFRGRRR